MFNNQIDTKYIILLKYLISTGYKRKKEPTQWVYKNTNIEIRFNSTDIIIKDITDNRRFYFNLDTSNTFLVNFLTYLNNNYNEVLI